MGKLVGFPGVPLPESERPRPVLDRETARAAAEALVRIASGRCPHCGAVPERTRQVGRSVVAEPCGHRMFQGYAKDWTAAVGRRRGAGGDR
jgi:uncharacterized protein (DUF983 family)